MPTTECLASAAETQRGDVPSLDAPLRSLGLGPSGCKEWPRRLRFIYDEPSCHGRDCVRIVVLGRRLSFDNGAEEQENALAMQSILPKHLTRILTINMQGRCQNNHRKEHDTVSNDGAKPLHICPRART